MCCVTDRGCSFNMSVGAECNRFVLEKARKWRESLENSSGVHIVPLTWQKFLLQQRELRRGGTLQDCDSQGRLWKFTHIFFDDFPLPIADKQAQVWRCRLLELCMLDYLVPKCGTADTLLTLHRQCALKQTAAGAPSFRPALRLSCFACVLCPTDVGAPMLTPAESRSAATTCFIFPYHTS